MYSVISGRYNNPITWIYRYTEIIREKAIFLFEAVFSSLNPQPPQLLNHNVITSPIKPFSPFYFPFSPFPFMHNYMTILQAVASYYKPLLSCYDYLLLTYSTLKRCNDRFTPFHANCLAFSGLYRGRAPLNTTQASSAAKKRSYIYFWKKFFWKKIAYCPSYFCFYFVYL